MWCNAEIRNMASYGNFWIHILISVYMSSKTGIYSQIVAEYCNGEVFEASCDQNEVVVMESAVFGRMKLGRCVKENLGFLGCQNSALSHLDARCSGEASCQFTVSNGLWRDVPGACKSALVGYAEVYYACRQVYPLTNDDCRGKEIQLNSENILIASKAISETCTAREKLRFKSAPGQRMNISLWSFHSESHQSYGTIRDGITGNTVDLTSGFRYRHVFTTVGNKAELDPREMNGQNIGFLIEIHVIGCKEISPPGGAWMTRDGGVMEIGCHSGSKTWSLRCENNKWVGILGQCGTDESVADKAVEEGIEGTWSVSLDVLLFGLCSVVILISACIFLAGVIVLKRKLTTAPRSVQYDTHTLNLVRDTRIAMEKDERNTMIFRGSTLPTTTIQTSSDVYKSLKPTTANEAYNEG